MASSGDEDVMDAIPDIEDEEEDLFGEEEEEEEAPAPLMRELSDRELDSDDDEGRNDRAPQDAEEEMNDQEGRDARIAEIDVYRHRIPRPTDGEINSLRIPEFIGIDPFPYDPATFKIPDKDHHSSTKSENFSASAVSASTIRFRKRNASELESNTNIYRWSDGSTTMSIGEEHYELQTKPLAPHPDSKYIETQDSHWYIAAPSMASQVLLLVGHMTNQYTVRPNEAVQDTALENLQKSLAAAARRGYKNDRGPEMISTTQDPELEKKRAEQAEKEKLKAQRRRENAAEKASQSHRPSVGRSGGLSLDDLEGRPSRRAPAAGRKVAKPRKQRQDYDSDDEPQRGRGREDEYDMEDDFLAPSDDEEVPEQDDEDEEEEEEREEPRAKKQKTSRDEDLSDADADAEADLDDDEAPAPQPAETTGRGRKQRQIIEDDDDDE